MDAREGALAPGPGGLRVGFVCLDLLTYLLSRLFRSCFRLRTM